MAAVETAEQAYSLLEALLRELTACDPKFRPTLYSLALRSALHPLLAPYREDPLLTLAGEYISLDACVASLCEGIFRLPSPDSVLRDLSEDDLWALGDLPTVGTLLSGVTPAAAVQIGSIGGALYLPAKGAATRCRIRAFFAAGNDPERMGCEPPVSVRAVGPVLESSAASAQRAALLFLEAAGLLPSEHLPGVFYYDISGPDIRDDLLPHVLGHSLELPLLLAFLSALTAEPIDACLGATGALGLAQPARDMPLLPVGHVAEKAEAFAVGCSDSSAAMFLATAAPGHAVKPVLTEVGALSEALSRVFPAYFGRSQSAMSFFAAETTETRGSEEGTVFFVARAEGDETMDLSSDAAGEWKSVVQRAVVRSHGLPVSPPAADHGSGTMIHARFRSVGEAVRAAGEVALALRFYPWNNTAEGRTGVRKSLPGFGIHCAGSEAVDEDAAALAWEPLSQHAARIAEVANPGQTLLSAPAQNRLTEIENARLAVRALGSHRLRDLAPAVPLWQAITGGGRRNRDTSAIGDAAQRTPLAPRSLDGFRHNLPFHLTPTVGRSGDIETIRRLVTERGSASRLTTVVGAGGVGKTRVAQAVGAEVLSAFSEGVWFIRVDSEVQTAEDVAHLVAARLQIPGVPKGMSEANPNLKAVIEAFSNARILLILDGCENGSMNSAVGNFAAALLATAPHAGILATARNSIGIPAETVYPLPPLRFQAGSDNDGSTAGSESPAVALFCARAQQNSPGFILAGPDDRKLAAILCGRLEGLPLAIELAAAQVGLLSLSEIAARLDAASAASHPLHRQPVMNRILEWSFALLEPVEQDLLCALSVFQDGFDSDAASAMADALQADREAIQRLEDRSLIRQRRDGSPRFDLHSLIQTFAGRKLAVSGNENVVRSHYADYFVHFAARYGADEPNSDREAMAFDRLSLDFNNLRAVFEFLRRNDPARVPAFVVDLANFLRYRGHLRERRAWLGLALRLLPDARERATEITARAHLYRAAVFMDMNAPADAAAHLEAAYGTAVAANAMSIAAAALNQRGLLRSRAEDWEAALTDFQEARQINRRLQSKHGEVMALNNLGLLAARQGQNEAARLWFEESAGLSRTIEDRRGLAVAVGNLGYLALELDDLSTARRCFDECLAEGRAMRDATRVAHGLLNLGDVLNRQQNWEAGTPLLAIAEAMLKRQRHRTLAEATRYLDDAQARYGAARVAALRHQFSRLSLPQLLLLDPSRHTPRRLHLPGETNE